jgi:hypothetical protein
MAYGGFWIRVVAYFIDTIILLVLLGVLYFALTAVGLIDWTTISALADQSAMQPGAEPDPALVMEMTRQMGMFICSFLLAWLYDAADLIAHAGAPGRWFLACGWPRPTASRSALAAPPAVSSARSYRE